MCSKIHRQQNSIYFILSLIAVIWSDCAISSERSLPKDLVTGGNMEIDSIHIQLMQAGELMQTTCLHLR
jgi:hypothetical protein